MTPDKPNPLGRLADMRRQSESGGGEDRLRRHREAGKLTARERITLLFDPDSFEETDAFVTHRCRDFGMADQIIPGDGVVSGHGRVDAASSTLSRKTSPSSADRSPKPTRPRSSRSWTSL